MIRDLAQHQGLGMASVRARYPRLMIPDDPPRIVGHECRVCRRRAFPPDPYGCERCGASADELAPIELVALGVIHALATVHRHHHDRPETPFTVATVVLDGAGPGGGITLKAVLTGDETEARVGARVEGVNVLWDRDADGTEIVDLRFRVAAPQPGSV